LGERGEFGVEEAEGAAAERFVLGRDSTDRRRRPERLAGDVAGTLRLWDRLEGYGIAVML
jgi:hypothetical protein